MNDNGTSAYSRIVLALRQWENNLTEGTVVGVSFRGDITLILVATAFVDELMYFKVTTDEGVLLDVYVHPSQANVMIGRVPVAGKNIIRKPIEFNYQFPSGVTPQ